MVAVKGKTEAVRIYEPLGERGELPSERVHRRDRFEEGLVAYRARRWDAATEAFEEVLAAEAEDGPAQVFLERIEAFRENPPDEDWDGTCHLTTK